MAVGATETEPLATGVPLPMPWSRMKASAFFVVQERVAFLPVMIFVGVAVRAQDGAGAGVDAFCVATGVVEVATGVVEDASVVDAVDVVVVDVVDDAIVVDASVTLYVPLFF